MERERRRAQILDVAKAVFAERGYHQATIDDIVARAQVARGTFYLYFDDKRAVFEQIVDGLVERIAGAIRPIRLDAADATPLEQLARNLRTVVGLFADDPDMARILFSAAPGLDPDFDAKLLAFYDQMAALIGNALDAGVAAGIVRAGDQRTRVFGLLGVVKELVYQVSVRRVVDVDAERIVQAALELLAGGILTESARRPPRG
jgi:AcrR family transcriptional regulator